MSIHDRFNDDMAMEPALSDVQEIHNHLLKSMYWYRTQYVKNEIDNFFKQNPNDGSLSIVADEKICSQHYDGNNAVEAALQEILPANYILDAGCGLGAPARYIASRTPIDTQIVGIEINDDFVSMSENINSQMVLNGVLPPNKVKYLKWDLTELDTLPLSVINKEEGKLFDGMYSFLVFLHISEKEKLFNSMSRTLKIGAKICVEDFIMPSNVTTNLDGVQRAQIDHLLRDVVSCALPLPNRNEYLGFLEASGFHVDKIVNLTKEWTEFTANRARAYKEARNNLLRMHDKDAVLEYQKFYDSVASLFKEGSSLEGVRITATKVK
jgi:SAM-dependent methyltransferase